MLKISPFAIIPFLPAVAISRIATLAFEHAGQVQQIVGHKGGVPIGEVELIYVADRLKKLARSKAHARHSGSRNF